MTDRTERAQALEAALRILTATVRGECPSLLNEDSGGCAWLSAEIDALLAVQPPPPAGTPTQDVTCEHGTAMDVHCCHCHSGFIFDANHECPTPELTWREAIEQALGVESDPENHTTAWAFEAVRAIREIGNQSPVAPPTGDSPTSKAGLPVKGCNCYLCRDARSAPEEPEPCVWRLGRQSRYIWQAHGSYHYVETIDGWQFCPYCGAPLKVEREPDTKSDAWRRRL